MEHVFQWNKADIQKHRFTRDEKCTMPEACKKCHGMMEEGTGLLSERVKGWMPYCGGDIHTSHCSRMEVCLREVTSESWRFEEAWCIIDKESYLLNLGCRYKVD